jgi:hypothetical protein
MSMSFNISLFSLYNLACASLVSFLFLKFARIDMLIMTESPPIAEVGDTQETKIREEIWYQKNSKRLLMLAEMLRRVSRS